MYEILKVKYNDDENRLSISAIEHESATDVDDGVALCGARYLEHELVEINSHGDIAANSILSFSGRLSSIIGYCSVCVMMAMDDEYLTQLNARVTGMSRYIATGLSTR